MPLQVVRRVYSWLTQNSRKGRLSSVDGYLGNLFLSLRTCGLSVVFVFPRTLLHPKLFQCTMSPRVPPPFSFPSGRTTISPARLLSLLLLPRTFPSRSLTCFS